MEYRNSQAILNQCWLYDSEAYEDYGYLHFRNLNQLDTYLKKVVPELIQEREKFLQFYTHKPYVI